MQNRKLLSNEAPSPGDLIPIHAVSGLISTVPISMVLSVAGSPCPSVLGIVLPLPSLAESPPSCPRPGRASFLLKVSHEIWTLSIWVPGSFP